MLVVEKEPQVARDDQGIVAALLRFVRGEWLGEDLKGEERRFLPSLLLGLYEANLRGDSLTKRQACATMHADPTTSGPKYIALAKEKGLLTIELKPPRDRRKDFLHPTEGLKELIRAEIRILCRAIGLDGVGTFDRKPVAVKRERIAPSWGLQTGRFNSANGEEDWMDGADRIIKH